MGGTTGDTQYTCFDMFGGNIAVGGTSSDTGLVSSVSKPILVYINSDGTQDWAK
jgi:hypothetical protein